MSDTNSNFSAMRRRGRGFILFPFLFIAAGLLMGAVVMYLWNAILPAVAGVGALTYWQAVGLLILCRILFGGFRGGGGHWRRKGFGGQAPHLRNRWMQMSDEERARFREAYRERCRNKNNN